MAGYSRVEFSIGYKTPDRYLFVKTFNPFDCAYKQKTLSKYPVIDRAYVSSNHINDVKFKLVSLCRKNDV